MKLMSDRPADICLVTKTFLLSIYTHPPPLLFPQCKQNPVHPRSRTQARRILFSRPKLAQKSPIGRVASQ